MTIQAVVFDLDGVIVDSEHLWEEAWRACCRRRGVGWSRDDTTTVQGMSAPEWSAYLARKLTDGTTADVVADECVGHVIEAVHNDEAPLLTGAGELVAATAARVPIGLASSAARRVIDAVLVEHELTERFSATVSSEEVDRGKPHPDVYLAATRRLGLAPESCLAIEDSGNGIRAAHAAGLYVVAIPNAVYPPKADAVKLADYVARDHAEATRHIEQRLP